MRYWASGTNNLSGLNDRRMKLGKQIPTSFCNILEAQVRETFGMSMRKDIGKGWEDFCYRIAIWVKNGRWTKFWWGESVERSISLIVQKSFF